MAIQHINATPADIKGNAKVGRYIFLTGSDDRARKISQFFTNVTVLTHARQHNLYLGTINDSQTNTNIDVAAIAIGMGGSSADIIINELLELGAKRLLRVGTAGSLQPDQIKVGDIVIASAAVRDDKASWDYIYPEYPAVSSVEYFVALNGAIVNMDINYNLNFGIVHSKSSLYAREFAKSFRADNDAYMQSLKKAGVLATEMECAQLFVLTSLMNARNTDTDNLVLCGAILSIVGDDTPFSKDKEKVTQAIKNGVILALETTKKLAQMDRSSQESEENQEE